MRQADDEAGDRPAPRAAAAPEIESHDSELRRFRFAVEQAPDAVFWMDQSGRFPYVNEQACRSLGYTREELAGLYLWEIDPYFPKERLDDEWAGYRKGELGMQHLETFHRRKDGTLFPVEVASKHFWFADAEFHVAFVRDITERRRVEEEKTRLEAQLVQAQKMESVGRLAGGVAHEFNNMLSVILGSVELMKPELPPGHPLLKRLLEVERAADRARDTTRQLLAFSRKQIISPRPLTLNTVIGDTRETLARLIGEDVELRFQPAAGLGRVLADRNQLEQILFNLAVNARDAMPAGGRLTIETAEVRLDEAFCRRHPGSTPGAYALLRVSDDGAGMDGEALSHAFEPFFTTKEQGRGTGLGLATVYGIVKQNHGFIEIESSPERGTSLRIYLPLTDATGEEGAEHDESEPPTSSGRILLVEDDPLVRETTVGMLRQLGFTVQAVEAAQDALRLCEAGRDPFDLVVSDVVMPGASGIELKRRLETSNPGLSVLFMSGYTADVVTQHGVLVEGIDFIQKPFTMSALARKIEEMRGRRDARRPDGAPAKP